MQNQISLTRGIRVALSPHFSSNEFDCKCSDPSCTSYTLDADLIAKLEALRKKTGPLKITSGYRCAKYQAELRSRGYETALGVSQHQLGRAADVTGEDTGYSGSQLEAWAREAGFMAVGVGSVWIHCDLRNDEERRWTYTR